MERILISGGTTYWRVSLVWEKIKKCFFEHFGKCLYSVFDSVNGWTLLKIFEDFWTLSSVFRGSRFTGVKSLAILLSPGGWDQIDFLKIYFHYSSQCSRYSETSRVIWTSWRSFWIKPRGDALRPSKHFEVLLNSSSKIKKFEQFSSLTFETDLMDIWNPNEI